MMNKVFVTGASGFIGKSLCNALAEQGYSVRKAIRGSNRDNQPHIYTIGNIGPDTEWSSALKGIDIVIHLAAHVHIVKKNKPDLSEVYRYVNVEGTERLAQKAALCGVKRFIYLSSIKVNGESTSSTPFTENDSPNPQDAYAVSKWEAEQILWRIGSGTGMEIIIIRPTLVYGSGVKANLLNLMKVVDRGIALPLTLVSNRRSMIALDNLVDFILHCAKNREVSNDIFLVSDGEDLSTPGLIRRLAACMGRPARLIPCPLPLMRLGGRLFGRQTLVDRLCDSLQVDISKAKTLLGWAPPISVDEGLRKTVNWYMSQKRKC